MAKLAQKELMSRLNFLCNSEDYSDFTITSGKDTYKVHKAIVCSQSGFFAKAVKFPAGKEAAEANVSLHEDDPVVVKLLRDFFYQSEYDPRARTDDFMIANKSSDHKYYFPHTCDPHGGCQDPSVCPHHCCTSFRCEENCRDFVCVECTGAHTHNDPADLLLHAKMYEIADKYDISGLKMLAREKFRRSCVQYWDNEVFVPAFEYALSTTPDEDQGLRETLIEVVVRHRAVLDQAGISDIMGQDTEFAFNVMQRQVKELDRLRSKI